MGVGHFESRFAAALADEIAPDGSAVRLLAQGSSGGLCECRLPAGTTSRAVRHRTIDELWYFLSGTGELWRRLPTGEEDVVQCVPGLSVAIPTGTAFQFRATGEEPLVFLDACTPVWPGPEEAVPVDGPWTPTAPSDGT